MNCYCCGKPLKNNDINGWHPACVKRFFGTNTIPEIEIDEKALEEIAKENTSKGIFRVSSFFLPLPSPPTRQRISRQAAKPRGRR